MRKKDDKKDSILPELILGGLFYLIVFTILLKPIIEELIYTFLQ